LRSKHEQGDPEQAGSSRKRGARKKKPIYAAGKRPGTEKAKTGSGSVSHNPEGHCNAQRDPEGREAGNIGSKKNPVKKRPSFGLNQRPTDRLQTWGTKVLSFQRGPRWGQ